MDWSASVLREQKTVFCLKNIILKNKNRWLMTTMFMLMNKTYHNSNNNNNNDFRCNFTNCTIQDGWVQRGMQCEMELVEFLLELFFILVYLLFSHYFFHRQTEEVES